jgi:hypothetical protein
VPDRDASGHFNVTSLVQPPKCSDCLKIKVLSHDVPNKTLYTEVTLKNATKLSAYEARGIVLPKVGGIKLLDAQGYTDLWNKGAFSVHNPFHVFYTSDYLHTFDSGGADTREYDIHYTIDKSLQQIGFALDVSYPDAVEDAYEIDPPGSESVFLGSTPAKIEVTVHDWQANTESVRVYAFPLTGANADQYVDMTYGGANKWSANVTNTNNMVPGEYQIWVRAKSGGSDIPAWQTFSVKVQAQGSDTAEVAVRYYVAKDADGFLPYYEYPEGGYEDFTLDIAKSLRAKATALWSQYGFKLIDNGVFKVMDDDVNDTDFFLVDSFTEALQMHDQYGKVYAPAALSIYFIEAMNGMDTAACGWDHSIISLAQHKSKDVFIIVSPNVWHDDNVLAHEGGHAFGALEDIYLLSPPSYMCDQLKADRPPWFQYLYCDDTAYYEGNLMWFGMPDWTIDKYNLTDGQSEFAREFQKNFPDNW